MDKLKMMSMDNTQENIKKIQFMFPNAVTEVKRNGRVQLAIDFDVLKQEMSTVLIDDNEERYQMTWPDKKKSILLANSPINKTLRPVITDETTPSGEDSQGEPYLSSGSVGRDGTKGGIDSENLYIEGDNLDVLKLLQETYLGKIKMIYIDPPYNTGNDFIYNDDFAEDADYYLDRSGQFDEQGNRLVQNTESNGRFHTDWLNMIYPRLKVAKDLLSDDGVIFISIDDNEVENMRKCCDDILGCINFLAEFPRVIKRGGKSTDTYAKNHDYILVYAKNNTVTQICGITHIDEGFKYKDSYFDKRGPYKLNQTLDYNTLQYNITMDYPIVIKGKTYVPGGDMELYKQRHTGKHAKHDWVWRWSKNMFDFGYENDWIEISKSGRIYTKTYLNANISKNGGNYYIEYKKRTKPISTLNFTENCYSNDNSNKEITSLMGATLFDYVKPTSLVKQLMISCIQKDSIILDFFSGSATTAHAVMQLNAEDGGNRKFIMVQLPEVCDEKSEAYKAGYKNICEIGKERIRRAGNKIKQQVEEENKKKSADELMKLIANAKNEEEKAKIQNNYLKKYPDIGFRVLKLDSSNMKDVYYKPNEYTQSLLSSLEDNIKEDRTPLDLLFQVMLDLGKPLSAKIETVEFAPAKQYFNVDDGDLICCFDINLTEEEMIKLAKLKPLYFVTRDCSALTDNYLVNFDQYFATYSPNTVRKII